MRLGVTFPQYEIGNDPDEIRRYARAAEELGYAHLLAYDHVLGADPAERPGWRGYTHEQAFHEIFVLFGFLAAATSRLELVADVLVLPQRQAALAAKQAAEVDVLSGGRLRLGVGVGWNAVEYEALGMSFTTRGKLIEEQIELMRLLWTQPIVTFEGIGHRVTAAGINPLPVQRPIPIWIGGHADVTLRRTARLGDGWFPLGPPDEEMRERVERLRAYAREAGRSPGEIGVEPRVNLSAGGPDDWRREIKGWRDLGATHIAVNTMGAGLPSPEAHIDAIERFKRAAEDA